MSLRRSPRHTLQYISPEFTVLEALSATGLRAIRYAKEIPGMKLVPFIVLSILDGFSDIRSGMTEQVHYRQRLLADSLRGHAPQRRV